MLPMLLITCRQEGIVSLNGAFAGEVRPDAPLLRPVNAYGPLYIGFQPLSPGTYSFARRVAFSAGKPVPTAFQGLGNLSAVSWPFGVTEIELTPPRVEEAPQSEAVGGAAWRMRLIRAGSRARIELDAAGRVYSHSLPEGAQTPTVAESEGQMFLTGATGAGQRYLLALSAGGERELFRATGQDIAFLGGRRVAVAQALGDTAGHVRRTVYRDAGEGYLAETEELLPGPDGPFQPATPQACALAAAEALQLGLAGESDILFTEGAQPSPAALALLMATASCAPLRFSPPDGRSAIAALRAESETLAIAEPLFYTARLQDGAWRLTSLTSDADRDLQHTKPTF